MGSEQLETPGTLPLSPGASQLKVLPIAHKDAVTRSAPAPHDAGGGSSTHAAGRAPAAGVGPPAPLDRGADRPSVNDTTDSQEGCPTMSEADAATELDVRQRMVDATIDLLAEEGPQALQARRVGSAVGASSMVLYGRFGGMPQMVEADRGGLPAACSVFCRDRALRGSRRRHGQARARVPRGRPAESAPVRPDVRLVDARRLPADRTAATYASSRGRCALDEVYRPVVVNAKWAIRASASVARTRSEGRAECWSFVYGFTALELGGYFSQFEDPITDVFASLMRHVAVGLGDTPQRAGRSIAAAIATTRG